MPNDFFSSVPIYRLPDRKIDPKHGDLASKVWAAIPKNEYETGENVAFLQKILAAAKLNWENDICLFALDDQDRLSSEGLTEMRDKVVLVFGLTPRHLGLQIKGDLDTILTFNQNRILFSHTLAEIHNNQVYKKYLWTALQELFKL